LAFVQAAAVTCGGGVLPTRNADHHQYASKGHTRSNETTSALGAFACRGADDAHMWRLNCFVDVTVGRHSSPVHFASVIGVDVPSGIASVCVLEMHHLITLGAADRRVAPA
jgi:hypothetical protein